MKVFFIHGLESHPNGSKTRALRDQGFEVFAPDLQMGITQLHRQNSVLRMSLRSRELQLAVAVFLGSLAMVLPYPWLGSCGAACCVLWGVVRRRKIFSNALHRSFLACVDVAQRALHGSAPDVIVGSSWGGAIAAELVLLGAWKGPTVLLAPALSSIDRKTLRGDAQTRVERLQALSKEVPIVIFHDPSDTVIPHADSVALADNSNIELRSVDAGGHRLLPLVLDGELAAALRTWKRFGTAQ